MAARIGRRPCPLPATASPGSFKRRDRPVTRLGRPVRRILTGSEAEIPRLGETLTRVLLLGSENTTEAARRYADLLIKAAC